MNIQPGQQALRKGRVSIPGQIYLVTTTTNNRRPIFADWCVAHTAVQTFTKPRVLQQTQLLCWVLMPDHVHWLIQVDQQTLSGEVKRLKAATAREINRRFGSTGSLWQPGFHDRAIRRDEDIRQVARYIVANPLRAGLVEHIGDYPFWDAAWL